MLKTIKRKILWLSILLAAACNQSTQHTNEERETDEQPAVEGEVWPVPEGGAIVNLAKNEISEKGELVKMEVKLLNLKLLVDEHLPADFAPLTIVVQIQTPENVRFNDGEAILEHEVDIHKIEADGSYTFTNELIGYRPGVIGIFVSWKWKILSEGCCSTALLAILAGCGNNAACICSTLAGMAAPGSWCCKLHPLTFRYYWSFYGCTGPSPY